MRIELNDDGYVELTGVTAVNDVIRLTIHEAVKLSEAIVAAVDEHPWPANKGPLIGLLMRGDTPVQVFADLDDKHKVVTVGNLWDEDEAIICSENMKDWQEVINQYPETATKQHAVA